MTNTEVQQGVGTLVGWMGVKLGDVIDQRSEIIQPSLKLREKFVGLEHIESGESSLKKFETNADLKSTKSRFYPGDILYGKLRPYLDKAAISNFEGICSTDLLVLTPHQAKSLPDFLINVLHSHGFIEYAISTTSGTNHPRTSWKAISEYEFALPPLKEQRRIATVLSTVDNVIQKSRLAAKETELLKAGVMHELMTMGIAHTEFHIDEEVGKVPKGWEIKQLGDVCTVKTGPFGAQLHMSDYVEKGTPIITVEHLGDLGVIHEKIPLVSDEDKERLKEYLLKEGDIVFSRVGSVDRSCYISKKEAGWLFSGRLLRVRSATDELIPTYLNYYFSFEGFKHRIRSAAVGGTMANLNTAIMNQIKIIFPPPQEQQKITTVLSAIDRKLSFQRKRTAHYEQLKQGLMNDLLTGKRRVKVT
jgi:type I restriction enzyme S subunit